MCENAINFITEKNCAFLVKDLIKIRIGDSVVQIRKLVVEIFGELDQAELNSALELKELKLVHILF